MKQFYNLFFFLIIYYSLIIINFVNAGFQCPNNCNGHGTCGTGSLCTCHIGYTLADCSGLICPSEKSWSSKPATENTAHTQSVECANMGVCDRNTGTCQCFEGFYGASCEKIACGNGCSGNGICASTEHLHDFYLPSSTIGSYTKWDGERTFACVCDAGYTGPACDMRMCPKGDDPLTPFTDYRTIEITTSSTAGLIAGFIKFRFEGEQISIDANANNFDATACKNALESLRNIDTVVCSRGTVDSNQGATWTLQLTVFPQFPHESNLYGHEGNPPISSFSCDTSGVYKGGEVELSGLSCSLTNVEVNTLKEYSYCSNRGKCDFNTGDCLCYGGFTGAACDTYVLGSGTTTTATPLDVLKVEATGTAYASNVLHLSTTNAANQDFNFLEASDNYRTLFVLGGNGSVNMNYGGLVIHDGGQTIHKGGLKVNRGGVTINNKGLTVTDGVTITNTGLYIGDGGITVGGGVEILTGGLKITGGVTLHTGGIKLEEGGLTIWNGGLTVNGGGMKVNRKGLTVASGGLKVVSGLTVLAGGIFIDTGGMTIMNGGVEIIREGLTLNSGGLMVTDGLSIPNGHLKVTDGMTVFTRGLAVTDGITLHNLL